MKCLRIKILLLIAIFLLPVTVWAQTATTEAVPEVTDSYYDLAEMETSSEEVKSTVKQIISDEEVAGIRQMIFVAEVDGVEYTIDTSQSYLEGLRYDLKEGDKIYLQLIKVNGEVSVVFLVDVVRTAPLIWIVLFFAIIIIAIGRWRGLASLAGLGITLGVLFLFLLPQILKGADPVLMTVIAAIFILGVNMHVAHGFSRVTLYAYGATVIGLIAVYVLATVFVAVTNLSGIASEEAALLFYQSETIVWPAGILLAGIILGAVGVLDDIAVTQAETVTELKEANPNLSRKELFVRAMRVGRHHIASTVNTLVLAYVGVALPLLLLFMMTSEIGALRFINQELVAEEIVRTLAGTTALVLTVPIATLFATFAQKK